MCPERRRTGEPPWLAGAASVFVARCLGTPAIADMQPSPAPNVPWVIRASAADAPAVAAEKMQRLTLADMVDFGLRHNSTTRIAWATAQAALATYGAARGAYLPTIDGD